MKAVPIKEKEYDGDASSGRKRQRRVEIKGRKGRGKKTNIGEME